MRKLLILLSIFCLGLLAALTVYTPSSALMWLASESTHYQAIRGILIGLLFVLFVTSPPRKLIVRAITASSSIALLIWVVESTLNYQMGILDSLVFLGVSLVIGTTALEESPHPLTKKPVSLITH